MLRLRQATLRPLSTTAVVCKPGYPRKQRQGAASGRFEDEVRASGTGRQVYKVQPQCRREALPLFWTLQNPKRFSGNAPLNQKRTIGQRPNMYYQDFKSIADKEIIHVIERLEKHRYIKSRTSPSVLHLRLKNPYQNRGLAQLYSKQGGRGVSVVSTVHPARKTQMALMDAQKIMSTGSSYQGNDKTDFGAADNGDDISDVFQGPGEELQGNLLPFDIKFGMTMNTDQPTRYGNQEMVKSPHFCHLTKPQIKKHCAELKNFMVPWPEFDKKDTRLRQEMPLVVRTTDYVGCSNNMADPRANYVEMRVQLDQLQLDQKKGERMKLLDMIGSHGQQSESGYHARHQLRGEAPGLHQEVTCRYDPIDKMIHFQSRFLPTRKQNSDYIQTLLQRLVATAKKKFSWEKDMVYDTESGLVTHDGCVEDTFKKTTDKYADQGIQSDDYESAHGRNKMWQNHKKDRSSMDRWSMVRDRFDAYEEYAQNNIKLFGLDKPLETTDENGTTVSEKRAEKPEIMRASWSKGGNAGSRMNPMKDPSYVRGHGWLHTQIDGHNENRGNL